MRRQQPAVRLLPSQAAVPDSTVPAVRFRYLQAGIAACPPLYRRTAACLREAELCARHLLVLVPS